MSGYEEVSRALGEKRTWSALLLAGAIVFLGNEALEALEIKNAVSVTALILLAAFLARPLLKT